MTPTRELLRYLCNQGATAPGDEAFASALHLELGGALYAALRRRGAAEAVPAPLVATLRAAHAENAAHALELLRCHAELRATLAARGVEIRALKGVAMLEHGLNPGARYCLDLDVLSRAEDRPRVHAALLELGYRTSGQGGAPKHLPEYRRGTIAVEVHEVAFWSRTRRFGLAELLAEAEPLAFTLAHLLHHAFVSSITTPALVAKTLIDATLIHELAEDAARVEARALELAREIGLGSRARALLDAAAALRDDGALDARAARMVALCEPASERELLGRELAYYARSAVLGPGWLRRDFLSSVLFEGDGPRTAPVAARRAAWLATRAISRLSRALIRG